MLNIKDYICSYEESIDMIKGKYVIICTLII